MTKIRSNYLFLLLYSLFIIYGSLFPLVDWRTPEESLLAVWQQAVGQHISRSDLLTNFLVYIPLGFLLSSVCSQRLGTFGKVMLTAILGGMLSFAMEFIQMYLPARTSSPVDLLLNFLSTLLGALSFGWFGRGSSLGEMLRTMRYRWFLDGRAVDIGLTVIVLWGAVQLAPFVPSIDVGALKNGLKPLWLTFYDLSRFSGYRAVTYSLNIFALGAVLMLIMKLRDVVPICLGMYCGIVLLTKITITGRQLSLEALVGLAIGVILTFGIRWLPRGGLVVAGVCSAAAAFVVETLRSDNTTVELHEFNWIPFSSQMGENVSGINSIIDGLWPFVVLAFFAVVQFPACRKKDALLTGLLLAIGVFILEYSQTSITGRFPDITVVLLAVIGWLLPLMYFRECRG